MRNVLIIILATSLFGCLSLNPYTVTIPAHQQAEHRRELKECEYEAKLHVRSPQAVSKYSIMADYDMSEQRKELVLACMESKGWRYTR